MPDPVTITWKEPFDLRRGGHLGRDWKREYTRTLRAVTSHPRIGQLAVMLACPIPLGASYSEGNAPTGTLAADGGAWARSIAAETEATGDGKNWLVTVEYGPDEPLEENPLDRKAEVSWDTTTEEEIADRDNAGEPILNTAFDAFDPPVTRPKKMPVAVVRRNEAEYPYDLAFALEDGINLEDFLEPGDAGKWKIAKISASSSSAKITTWSSLLTGEPEEVIYWVVTYELIYNYDGWARPILNQGMRQLTAAGTGYEPILVKGQPISSPALLGPTGRALAPDAAAVFLDFDLTRGVDFGLLNFAGVDFGKGPIP